MIRTAYINDIVRSFVYCVRTQERSNHWPMPITGIIVPVIPDQQFKVHPGSLQPFLLFATIAAPNYLVTSRAVILLVPFLRTLNFTEQAYAAEILHRHYLASIQYVRNFGEEFVQGDC